MCNIQVACGLIYSDRKILICRRRQEKFLGGFWEFPGGKVEKGETIKECINRELLEELGMIVEVTSYFTSVQFDYETFSIDLVSYLCKFQSSEYLLIDHDRYEWVSTQDLLKWKLAPADLSIAELLIKRNVISA